MTLGDTYNYLGDDYTIIAIDLENNTLHIRNEQTGYALDINTLNL